MCPADRSDLGDPSDAISAPKSQDLLKDATASIASSDSSGSSGSSGSSALTNDARPAKFEHLKDCTLPIANSVSLDLGEPSDDAGGAPDCIDGAL
mmetsp:Transcript_40272/g.116334  ORF Transcript_40272/g.116334 Transcript_40272/m.116334 type:complete len:95 (+) Transcript_40272:500-784(+)